LWEYKRKQRKIPKKEREKEKKEGFPSTMILSICKKFRKLPQNILIVIPLLHNTSDGEK